MSCPPDPVHLPASDEPADESSIGSLIRRFVAHLRRRGAASTAEAYGYWCGTLERYLEEHEITHLGQLGEHQLEGWQDQVKGAPKTRALAATAIRSWLRWLIERDLADWRLLRAVSSVKIPRGRARPIPRDELVLLVAKLGPTPAVANLRELRDRALFWYLLATGARISEALQAVREHFHDQVVVQKGGEPKRLRVPARIREIVQDYVAARTDNLPWLWVTNELGRPPRRLTRAAANVAWRRLAKKLGLLRWTNHRLRDTSATWLALQGLPAYAIVDHLGHANLSTVMKYVKVAEEQREDVLKAMEELLVDVPPRPPKLRGGVKLRGRPDRRPPRRPGK